ncbi:hypothetical protein GALMADRAFT_134829 [Galerina marginata CBS 339.88]|uniref:DUF974-domain-containing protein n=1 Tax=Galerina marginata (strain CBS 339.88) TaxID=685588 RepID=A0A067TNA7_GALM3|nr:hypothetical protein GALMADRAFT_134829 [Galerina marginata CBS 339.88]
MAATDGPVHLLSLKVMRVSRPELASAWQPFYSSSPSFSAHSTAAILSLQGTTPLPGHPKTLRDLTHASELLTLPSSFGSIQLGETFSSCLCVNNETEVVIEVAHIKVEMQTVTTKVVLYETDGLGGMLSGGDTLEHIVHHEIKELGQHVLACTVTYRLPPNSRSVPGASEDAADPSLQTFRKFYKFAVTNPLSVKTKVHTPKSPSAQLSPLEREKVFLEVHIQNLTQDAICFERMRLECTDGWEAEDGNMIPDEDGKDMSVFSGSMALMQPQDMRQYIYTLTPKNAELSPPIHAPGTIIPLGRLDISWRSSFGEPGRLLTSMLSRRIPLAPVPQPASALPPYLKRAVAGSTPSRPHSPSLSQSRPGSPPPFQRPGSPAVGRPASMSINRPQTPPQQPIVSLPEIEAQLIVRHIPRENIVVEKAFSISFAVVLSCNIPPGKEHTKRKVALAIQHIKPHIVLPPVFSPPVEAFTPKMPSSSGFSTPSSATATFNYALAHQKILAVTNRPTTAEVTMPESDMAKTDISLLPPPYFEDELKTSSSNGVSFVGASAVFLPPVEIHLSTAQGKVDGSTKAQVVQEFELPFIALRQGFSTIGGIRILLADGQLPEAAHEGDARNKPKRAHTLKEYDVVGEVWVST